MDDERCDTLLTEIATGDNTSFSDLYLEMNRPVYAYVLGIVNNQELAADITQDVFIKIKFNANKYKTKKNPRGWIFTLARNTALDSLKKQNRSIPADLTNCSGSGSFSNKLENSIVLKEALNTLTSKERQIVLLYFVSGFSQKSIAKLLKLPTTTINWKYRSAIKELSEILKVEGDF